ncbi:efflux transporter outer membrane subunit [Myxococcus sp. K38C18041901]|uniref:efflux transporter outer membrane subunit n=1 Tax=Myxococcus guangdongensis TaxID=2906760 RepID=UPI0020A6E56D|nr:efflux transporter outer membrane subunit [Myxococcus guangdongensis]MCP3060798.1 efflux transporter outer membrane subunit [Myxococcus guangdongensis]
MSASPPPCRASLLHRWGRIRSCRLGARVLATVMLGGCAVGPDYQRTQVAIPERFKEATEGWKPARPSDHHERGVWWAVFEDPTLSALEERVALANQTVAGFEAAYRRARALVAQARAGAYPVLGASASVGRSRGRGRGTGADAGATSVGNDYSLALDASWEPDLWGRVRRQVAGAKASAQSAAANLANAKLSAQALLAQSYFQLRAADATQQLLDDIVLAYQRTLTLTQNRYEQGVAARTDVLQARTQWLLARAAAAENEIARAQLEHAIAVLVGEPASSFAIVREPLRATPPEIPAQLPSSLLERRPDIAAAERAAAAANEQIGIAISAFFPSLTLSASGGFSSLTLAHWLSAPALVWSLGPQLVATLLDGGLRAAQTEAARAEYDQSVANYRQTVLAAFQDVEDTLVSLRMLEQEVALQEEGVQSARQVVDIVTNQYKAGTATYLDVIVAQTTAFGAEQKLVSIRGQRMVAAVGLIKALGGGWDARQLGTAPPKETKPR